MVNGLYVYEWIHARFSRRTVGCVYRHACVALPSRHTTVLRCGYAGHGIGMRGLPPIGIACLFREARRRVVRGEWVVVHLVIATIERRPYTIEMKRAYKQHKKHGSHVPKYAHQTCFCQ